MSSSETITLEPGQSVELPGGYVARSYREGPSYYAERTDALSPVFSTYAEAAAWLAEGRA